MDRVQERVVVLEGRVVVLEGQLALPFGPPEASEDEAEQPEEDEDQ